MKHSLVQLMDNILSTVQMVQMVISTLMVSHHDDGDFTQALNIYNLQ